MSASLGPSDFQNGTLKEAGVVVALFTTSWCPYCIKFDPVFDSTMKGTGLRAAKVDLSDLENPLWEAFGVEVVPTVIVFKDGKPAIRKDGILGRGLSKQSLDDVLGELKS